MTRTKKIEVMEEEFEGFGSDRTDWNSNFTEENGYIRYILFENSGELFRTQVECRKKTSVDGSALSKCLSGKADRYKNMRFRYVYLKEN